MDSSRREYRNRIYCFQSSSKRSVKGKDYLLPENYATYHRGDLKGTEASHSCRLEKIDVFLNIA